MKLKLFLTGLLFAPFMVLAEPTIEVQEYPDTVTPTSLGIIKNVKLSDVGDHMPIFDGEKVSGRYYINNLTVIGAKGGEKVDCCDAQGESTGKKKMKVKSSQLKIKVTWDVEMKVMDWEPGTAYATPCPSADAEWSRYRNAVLAHENSHHTAAKTFLTEEKVKELIGDLGDWESKCYDESELNDKAAKEFQEWSLEKSTEISDRILSAEKAADNTDQEQQAGTWPWIIDNSKDCP